MNRADLKRLARDRLRDAKALLATRRWSGAYYLAGYAVECALKACVIDRLMKTDAFPERRFSEQCWMHDLVQLVRVAGLEAALVAATAADPDMAGKWVVVKDWNESSRYIRKKRNAAQRLYNAITDKKHGVLPWIMLHW